MFKVWKGFLSKKHTTLMIAYKQPGSLHHFLEKQKNIKINLNIPHLKKIKLKVSID